MTREEYLMVAHQLTTRGTDRHNAVLNEDRVRAIRVNRHGWTTKRWAAEFGCHYRTVEKVLAFETWAHVR